MKRSGNGLMVSLIGIAIAASAARWLLTPSDHPKASDARAVAVVIQFVGGVALLGWGWWQDRADRRGRGSEYGVFASSVVGLCVGALLVGKAVHWLITPLSHPDASTLHTALVWGQAGVGGGLVAFSSTRLKRAVAA